MAKFANPRKVFNWSIQISPDPVNPFMFQKVTMPDAEIEQTAHGDTNHDIKTPGRVTYGNIIAEKLQPADMGDAYMWSWFDTCQSSLIGGGAPPEIIKKTITVVEMASDGATVLNTWLCFGVWPSKINGQEFDRNSSDNVIETIEFSVDKMNRI